MATGPLAIPKAKPEEPADSDGEEGKGTGDSQQEQKAEEGSGKSDKPDEGSSDSQKAAGAGDSEKAETGTGKSDKPDGGAGDSQKAEDGSSDSEKADKGASEASFESRLARARRAERRKVAAEYDERIRALEQQLAGQQQPPAQQPPAQQSTETSGSDYPERKDYVSDEAYDKALIAYFAGDDPSDEGLTDEAKARGPAPAQQQSAPDSQPAQSQRQPSEDQEPPHARRINALFEDAYASIDDLVGEEQSELRIQFEEALAHPDLSRRIVLSEAMLDRIANTDDAKALAEAFVKRPILSRRITRLNDEEKQEKALDDIVRKAARPSKREPKKTEAAEAPDLNKLPTAGAERPKKEDGGVNGSFQDFAKKQLEEREERRKSGGVSLVN